MAENITEELEKVQITEGLKRVQTILLEASITLADNLPPKQMMRRLRASGSLQQSEFEEIEGKGSKRDQIHALLEMFHRKSESDYRKLRQVLAELRPDIYIYLLLKEKEHNFTGPELKTGTNNSLIIRLLSIV